MKRVKADFDLEGAWETWIIEVDDNWKPGDSLTRENEDIEFVALIDSGNSCMDINETSIEELD